MPKPRTNAAFTLLELVLVMALIALVVAIVAPSLGAFGAGRRTHYAARRMLAMAEFARTSAVTEGRPWRMNFDPGARAVWLTVQNGSVFQPTSSDLGERSEASDGISLRTDLTANPEGTYVEFRPDGRTDPVHVWISDRQGREIELACQSPTEMFRELPREEMTR
jgi:type II secretion system protein H